MSGRPDLRIRASARNLPVVRSMARGLEPRGQLGAAADLCRSPATEGVDPAARCRSGRFEVKVTSIGCERGCCRRESVAAGESEEFTTADISPPQFPIFRLQGTLSANFFG